MTLKISVHKTILFQILKDIYSDTTIAPFLGFKGGTAALMFHDLNRFSVDLDFDLLDDSKKDYIAKRYKKRSDYIAKRYKKRSDYIFERVIEIVKKYGKLKESSKKRFNLLCVLSYEDKAHNVKVEINRRKFGSKYEIKTYLGVSMMVMTIQDMFANKLMAMHERIGKTSRDIYDVWFFLEHHFPINRDIVEKRAKMSFGKLMERCIQQLEKINNKNILDGLGELLTPGQKDWARAKLRLETIALLKLRLEDEK